MATASTQEQGFTGDELAHLTALIEKADSVELKLTVPEEDQRSAIAALGLDPLRGADPAGLLLRHARPRR